eukprot:CAMPEP_0119265938 /NCGR_PEP_ID=MMETSP1329-20130426/4593_1 /TAXON_ID=114041 /ORGANISM="Genus nov. species nov., Strain RCC1024" /LENGTH=611 /DNA_ID=CAMNT_0007265795 /DNA_START=9 /DNA_END=1840 /DNA_ORIENTATION=+
MSEGFADTPEQEELRQLLLKEGQAHLFKDWKASDTAAQRAAFYAQIGTLDASYPGGLAAYLKSARTLLIDSATGANPLDGWTPAVPAGESLELGSPTWLGYEAKGSAEVAASAFVLVAGGLGERLGYSRIKVELPTETATGTCYLKYYVDTLLALQREAGCGPLPLAIMVSGDTEKLTAELLAANNNFGAAPGQITLMKQEKVAALADNDAAIAAEGPYEVQAKPHGHGDVHVLLHQTGLVKKWAAAGRRWVYFFQDTNALGFRPLLATLGKAATDGLHCTFLAVPRLPGQAVGGIARLDHADGRAMTLNVEYNQLDPLLKATGGSGDVAGPDGVHSPFPGNINQFVLACGPYAETLERTSGVLGEFVNPKYKDASKKAFKKPARLECMMQDYPKVLGPEEKVGFVQVAAWASFSPCKNATADAATKKPPACALSAEADQYHHCAELLRWAGCDVAAQSQPEAWGGVAVDNVRPAVVLAPAFAPSLATLRARLPHPAFVKVSERSTLVLDGDVEVRSLALDGGLVVKCKPGARAVVDHCEATNGGFVRSPCAPDAAEALKIRGYYTAKASNVPTFELDSGAWLITTRGGEVVCEREKPLRVEVMGCQAGCA